jgi:hypothetical protein
MSTPDDYPQTTVDLLHGLIAECADMIRTQLRPGMDADTAADRKWGYANAVSNLVKIASQAGDTVARLRGHRAETRHRIIVQRLAEQQKGWGRGEQKMQNNDQAVAAR